MKKAVTSALLIAHAAVSETIERLDPALDRILAPGTELETLCTRFDWAEGPVWDPTETRLLATQIMSLVSILAVIENNPVRRDSEKYYVSIFGTPAIEKP